MNYKTSPMNGRPMTESSASVIARYYAAMVGKSDKDFRFNQSNSDHLNFGTLLARLENTEDYQIFMASKGYALICAPNIGFKVCESLLDEFKRLEPISIEIERQVKKLTSTAPPPPPVGVL